MGGTGARFLAERYVPPKPLIRLLPDRRMIIEHVLDMFPDNGERLIFVCNEHHLAETHMEEVLKKLRPNAIIVPIAPHKKGPVWTVKAAFDHIDPSEEVIVSYCDGTVNLDRERLSQHVKDQKLDGCLITHTGFHPHVLSKTTKMAFVKPTGNHIEQVKEKESYTNDPQSEHASSGVYWFQSGEIVKMYFEEYLNSQKGTYNGEHYVTLVYNLMIRDGLRVGYFDTSHVAILGTPDEVRNFEAWAAILGGAQVRNEEDLVRCYRYWKQYHQR
jgi:NDP-sugar pyrophosphorylase family protein